MTQTRKEALTELLQKLHARHVAWASRIKDSARDPENNHNMILFASRLSEADDIASEVRHMLAQEPDQ